MIIQIKNLGIIKEAVIDTSKKFTLFCGNNSTGKTYLSYILYALYSMDYPLMLKSFTSVKEEVESQGTATIKKEYLDEYIDVLCKYVKDNIGLVFGISENDEKKFFGDFSLKISYTDADFEPISKIMIYLGDRQLKPKYSNELDIAVLKDVTSNFSHRDWWNGTIRNLALLSKVKMFPVERNSIFTFKTELNINRSQLVDIMLSSQDNGAMAKLNSNARRYPLAIKNSINIASDLANMQKSNSSYLQFANELEESLLHGRVIVNDNGDVDFCPNENVMLPFSMSSSIVKTLSSLVVYLKHEANLNDFLIIDEPEMNFHPSNQVLLAPMFSKLVNSKFNLVVSTHSDYIIREINNLIVAKSLKDKGDDAYKQYYKEDSLLDFKDVQVLYFDFDKDGFVRVKSLDVDEYGFAVDSIDETINQQNQRMMDLFGRMNESNNSNDVEND